MQPALHRLCRRAELFSAIELNCWYRVFTLRVEETWRAADSINAADAAAAAAAVLPPSSWVLPAHHVATRLHAKLQEVTPRGPKRVEIEISLL